jgi:uncharacterized protein YdaU (DUF1376 family)
MKAMANELHTMPLKIERLMSSRRVRMLALDEFGAYIKLLCDAWLDGGAIAGLWQMDSRAIARLLATDEKTAERVIENVVKVFFNESDGSNPTLVEVYSDTMEKTAKYRENGAKGSEKRWGKAIAGLSNGYKPSNSQAIAGLSNGYKPSNSIQSQSQSINNTPLTPIGGEHFDVVDKIKKTETIEIPDNLKSIAGFETAWSDWKEYRKERRIKTTSMTLKAQLAKLSETPNEAEAMIRQSIANGWQGLFPLKHESTQNGIDRRGLAVGQCWQSDQPVDFDLSKQSLYKQIPRGLLNGNDRTRDE